jgi:molecular chaperone IbpA
MQNYDFTPLFRHSVGFDHFQSLLDNMVSYDQTTSNSYPPYNIETLSTDSYRISMAVAGFSESDLEIVATEDNLTIKGEIETLDSRKFLHRGIAGRSFERSFSLADHVKVIDAQMDNGLLHVDLIRELPESKKPRRIEIKKNLQSTIKAKASKFIGEKTKSIV